MLNLETIDPGLQKTTIELYWQMLQECEHGAGDSPLNRHMVEAYYRHWNTMTGDDKKPEWMR